MQYNRAELNGSTTAYENARHVNISEKEGLFKIEEKI
jgi:hypothetical protein